MESYSTALNKYAKSEACFGISFNYSKTGIIKHYNLYSGLCYICSSLSRLIPGGKHEAVPKASDTVIHLGQQ